MSQGNKKKRCKAPKQVVNLVNCSGIQIGNDNVSYSMTSQDSLKDSEESKNEKGLSLVTEILKHNPRGLTISDLQEYIDETLKENQDKSFFQVSGRNLGVFLRYNRRDFDVSGKHQQVVRLRGGKDNVVGVYNSRSLCIQNKVGLKIDLNQKSSSNITDAIDNAEVQQRSIARQWLKVTKKQRKGRAKCSQSKSTEKSDFPFIVDGKLQVFSDLISGENSRDLCIFIGNAEIYNSCSLRCMKDIVCLWNTPRRDTSYIVIGVERMSCPMKLNGIKKPFPACFWDGLFLDNEFTYKPKFEWHEIFYQEKLFYLITVLSSYNHGCPTIVRKPIKATDFTMNENELWYQTDTGNTICSSANSFIAVIYGWFTGSDSIQDKQETERSIANRTNSTIDGTVGPSSSFEFFWKRMSRFKKGKVVMITGNVPFAPQNMCNLGLLPLQAVYDFDVFSRSSGLFNAVQDTIEDNRVLHIATWKDTDLPLSVSGTLWCFMRGRQEIADSRTDNEDGSVESVNHWARAIKSRLQEHCERLASFSEDYSPLTFLLVWPEDEKLLPHMQRFLERTVETMSYSPSIVILMLGDTITEGGKQRLEVMQNDFKENLKVMKIDFDILCQGISEHISTEQSEAVVYKLPKGEDCNQTPITRKDAYWLGDDIEVLYVGEILTFEDEEIEERICTFYRGGSLHWSVWYKYGEDVVEIEREVLKRLSDAVKPKLAAFRTQIIYLYHSPGSGGSTLAQRILWKFHQTTPCLHAKFGTITRSKDIVQKVTFVHERTKLPVLLLIDGEEEAKVRYLSSVLRYTVILYVKRYPYKVRQPSIKDAVYMDGIVTEKEAKQLATRFGERCNDKKKQSLDRLSREVSKGRQHNLYEFGMTAYHHEFKGIHSYVRGYLQLNLNSSKDLLPWQKCVAYLSLVYYYGQSSVPCQFFASLFEKPANYIMTFEEDFPHPISEFVVKDARDKRNDNIRICHYAVAKEILEQILVRIKVPEQSDRSEQLSLPARRNLAPFCKEFIEYTGKKDRGKNVLSTFTKLILARTFIYRDERDMGENEEQVRKRPVLSKLMVDIPAGPLFVERLQILEKLVSTFPNDPNFHAHLGRFYAFCRNDEEEKVEMHFKKAISLCEAIQKGKSDEDLDDCTKSTLTHVYHMYGIVKHRYLAKYGKGSLKFKNGEEAFFSTYKELVGVAQLSCFYFLKSRELTPDARDVYAYAYTGEIQVRLQMCDYVKQFYKTQDASEYIFGRFFSSQIDDTSKEFVKESITIIEALILECYTDVELPRGDTTSLSTLVEWYNELFNKQCLLFEASTGNEGRRHEISISKLQFGTPTTLGEIESINDRQTLEKIVKLYEDIFQDAMSYGCNGKLDKRNLERDYREWILAIRQEQFKKEYQLEDVLLHVQNWHNLVKSPSSTFYLFVLLSLLGFAGKTECKLKATEVKEEMMKMNRLIIRPKYPREWLGSGTSGIKMLIAGNRHVGICPEERALSGLSVNGLKICKGTICHPNKNSVGGYIEYDIITGNVKVFFIPKRVNMIGRRFAGHRVEFNLAFSIELGYEAFNVKQLTRHGCSSCCKVHEFTSTETILRCPCGVIVQKDHLNDITTDS